MLPVLLRSKAWAIWARSGDAVTAALEGGVATATCRRAAVGAAPLTTAAAEGQRTTDGGSDAQAVKDKLVDAALRHVKQMGWTQAALVAAARDLGLSPAAAGLLPGGAAGLVAAVIQRHNRTLAHELQEAQGIIARQQQQQQQVSPAVSALAEALSSPDPTRRLAAALRRRLELGVAPHIDTWPQALAALAQPTPGAGTAGAARPLALLAELSDEVLAATGDAAIEMDWYARRAAVAGVYAATELFMLTDFSPNYQETWAALDRRLKDLEALRAAAAGVGSAPLSLLQWGLSSAGQVASAAAGSGKQQQQQATADGPAGTWPGAQGAED